MGKKLIQNQPFDRDEIDGTGKVRRFDFNRILICSVYLLIFVETSHGGTIYTFTMSWPSHKPPQLPISLVIPQTTNNRHVQVLTLQEGQERGWVLEV
jgi:hypothetical protein